MRSDFAAPDRPKYGRRAVPRRDRGAARRRVESNRCERHHCEAFGRSPDWRSPRVGGHCRSARVRRVRPPPGTDPAADGPDRSAARLREADHILGPDTLVRISLHRSPQCRL